MQWELTGNSLGVHRRNRETRYEHARRSPEEDCKSHHKNVGDYRIGRMVVPSSPSFRAAPSVGPPRLMVVPPRPTIIIKGLAKVKSKHRARVRTMQLGTHWSALGACQDGAREFVGRRPRLAGRLSRVAERLAGSWKGLDDAVGAHRVFVRISPKASGRSLGTRQEITGGGP
ncbi:hypothetical protein BHM03_00055265 [Ensete ventricosum]|nr:hypothetical protein BHM03_00055265 [Ensete ventricosum]